MANALLPLGALLAGGGVVLLVLSSSSSPPATGASAFTGARLRAFPVLGPGVAMLEVGGVL